jgi:hypothetical protein
LKLESLGVRERGDSCDRPRARGGITNVDEYAVGDVEKRGKEKEQPRFGVFDRLHKLKYRVSMDWGFTGSRESPWRTCSFLNVLFSKPVSFSLMRKTTFFFSSSDKNLAFSGVSGSKYRMRAPQPIVMAPYIWLGDQFLS